MKRYRSTPVAVSLAIVFTAVSTIGCSSDSAGTSAPSRTEPAAAVETQNWQRTEPGAGGLALPVVREPARYSFMTQEQGSMPFRDSFVVVPEIARRTNVQFELIKVPQTNYADKLSVTLASGELPDLIAGVSVSTANQLGPKGLFLNIWDYIDEMPNLKQSFAKFPEFNDYKYSDNELYQIMNQCSPDSDPQGFGYYTQIPMIRTDILAKLGLPSPATFDELRHVLGEMKKAYPNSSPWINAGGLESILQQMLVAWNGNVLDYTNNYATYDKTNKQWAFGPEQPGFKEMIEYLSALYKDGLLDKEFMVTNQSQWEERAINDKGFFTYSYWNDSDFITQKARAKGSSEFQMMGFLPPKKDGVNGVIVRQACTNFSAVSAKVKDPVPLLKALDYWLYSQDGTMLANAGIEGVNYTWEEPNKIYKLVDPELKNPTNETHKEKFGVRYGFMTGLRPDHFDIHNLVYNEGSDMYHQQYLIYKGHDVKPAPVKIFKNADDASQMKLLGVPIKDYVAQQLTKFITGATAFDQWDVFIQTCRKMGSAQMVELLNQK